MKRACTKCLKEFEEKDFPLRKGSSILRGKRCSKCKNSKAATWGTRNPEKMAVARKKFITAGKSREWRLKTGYSITSKEYNQLLLAQGNACAICRKTSPGGKHSRFVVDHCHRAGTIRGLLCNNCNRGLGFFHDSSDLLANALSYIATKMAGELTLYQHGADAAVRHRGDNALFGGHGTKEMKQRLGIKNSRPLADFLPTVTLKAKEFAAAITDFNVRKNNLFGVGKIGDEHVKNNKDVRSVLAKSNIVPENLPAEEDMKKLERRVRSQENKILKTEKSLKEIEEA